MQAGTLTPAELESIKAQLDILFGLVEESAMEAGISGQKAGAVSDSLERISRSLEVLASMQDREQCRSPSVDYIDFDLFPRRADKIGRLAWGADDTLDINHSGGVTQQVGQEIYVRFLNNTGVAFANGDAIGVNPATNTVVKYIANGSMNSLGIVGVATQDIPNGSPGRVTVMGRVRNINTTGAPFGEVWVAGSLLYVSRTIAGGFTIVKPTAPSLSIPIGRVVSVHATEGIIFVRPVPEQQLFYGSFSKTADQVPSAANTAQALTWTNTETANGVSIGSPTSRVVVANAGLYKFSLSLQLTSSSASVKSVWSWFRKNGADIPNSSMITSLDSATAIRTPSRDLFFSLIAGDYIEVMFASDSTAMAVDSIPATAFAPAAPAAILTVNQEQQ